MSEPRSTISHLRVMRALSVSKTKDELHKVWTNAILCLLACPEIRPVLHHQNTFPADRKRRCNLTQEALGEALDNLLQSCLKVLAEGTLLVNGSQQVRLVGLEVRQEVRLPLEDLADGDVVEETVDTGEDKGNHLVDSHGRVLLLLQELGQL